MPLFCFDSCPVEWPVTRNPSVNSLLSIRTPNRVESTLPEYALSNGPGILLSRMNDDVEFNWGKVCVQEPSGSKVRYPIAA